MNETPPPKPTRGQAEHADDEVQQLKKLFRDYGQPVMIGLGIAVAVMLAFSAYKNYRRSSEQRAMMQLFSTGSAEELQQLARQNASTPTAPLAMLLGAARFYEQGRYDQAEATYDEFGRQYGDHLLGPMAQLGKAQCLEARRQFREAADGYARFMDEHEDHFLVPLAAFGNARCHEQLGEWDAARAVYEDFIAANPDSPWTATAETGLLYVEKGRRAPARPVTAISAPPVPPPAAPDAPLTKTVTLFDSPEAAEPQPEVEPGAEPAPQPDEEATPPPLSAAPPTAPSRQ